MPVLQGRLSNRQAIVQIGIQRFTPDLSPVRGQVAPAQMQISEYSALLDTGTQRSCLTAKVIAAERLVSHGKCMIKNVHGENPHRLHRVRFGFWYGGDELGSTDAGARSYFGLAGSVEVISISDNKNFDAIIGMDILEQFDFGFMRNGQFEIDLRAG